MTGDFSIPGGIVSMTAEAAEKLVSAGDGDAALLYLCLLRQGGELSPARKKLRWTEDRFLAACEKLMGLNLMKPGAAQEPELRKPEPDEPPEYSAADIIQEMESSSPFPALVGEVQRRLGKVLSATDLKILYTIYDYLALSAEVILLLVTWCVRRTEEKYGAGRKPTLPQIRAEAFRWKRQGADTPEAAEEYLKRMTALSKRSVRMLALLGVTDRAPVELEHKYLSAWAEMGFEDEAVRLAYEKTVLKKQAMSWPYMNSILKSWHQKGLRTVSQIESEDSVYRRGVPAGSSPAALAASGDADRRAREDMERMRRFLEDKKREESG
jgi:DnaD/phage-associated family protein